MQEMDAKLAHAADSGAAELAETRKIWCEKEKALTAEAQGLKQQLESLQAEQQKLAEQSGQKVSQSEVWFSS